MPALETAFYDGFVYLVIYFQKASLSIFELNSHLNGWINLSQN